MSRWIDVRREVKGFFHGDRRTVPQGRWAVLRMMRIGEYSPHWNADRQESVGGPKWNYDDHLVRITSKAGYAITFRPDIARTLTTLSGAGMEDVNGKVVAVEWNAELPREPDLVDILYDINKYQSKTKPVPPFKVTTRYRILNQMPEYGDDGRIEIVYLLVSRLHGEE